MGWYSGSNGGRALANVLSGAVNPSGRLPFVIPHDESHLPFFDRNAKAITYDYWHGQWKLDRDGNKAMFPFGFGCSYTTFSYSDVSVAIEKVVKVRCLRACLATTCETSNIDAVTPSSCNDVTEYSEIPHGTMWSLI